MANHVTGKTTNYALPLYEKGDWAALIEGYDTAMEIVDKWMFDAQAQIDALKKRCTDLENRATALEEWQEVINNWRTEVDNSITNINTTITHMGNEYDTAIQQIINKFLGGGTIDDDGNITWEHSAKAVLGDLNIFSGVSNPTSAVFSNAIRGRESLTDNDVKLV